MEATIIFVLVVVVLLVVGKGETVVDDDPEYTKLLKRFHEHFGNKYNHLELDKVAVKRLMKYFDSDRCYKQ